MRQKNYLPTYMSLRKTIIQYIATHSGVSPEELYTQFLPHTKTGRYLINTPDLLKRTIESIYEQDDTVFGLVNGIFTRFVQIPTKTE